ncbi:hypothetical protein RIF29_47786 [Crotalaria pallida]|uniref:Uncharacterized protein n=1 Tax=Crotalaria pallida TaxID=3830 RepID=A0AAN9DPT1_CROPI
MFFQSYALEGRNPPVPRDLSVPLSLTRSGLPSGVVLRPATSSIAFEARKLLRFWPASGNTSKGYFQVRGYTIMQKRSLPPQVSCLFPFPSLGLGYRGSSLQLTVSLRFQEPGIVGLKQARSKRQGQEKAGARAPLILDLDLQSLNSDSELTELLNSKRISGFPAAGSQASSVFADREREDQILDLQVLSRESLLASFREMETRALEDAYIIKDSQICSRRNDRCLLNLIRDSTVNGENFLRLLTTRGNLLDWLTTYYLSINNKETALVPYWLAWNARTEIDRLLESGFSGTHTHTDWTLTVLLGLKNNHPDFRPRQRPRRRGDRSNKESLDDVCFYSWAAVSRSRGRSAPCPRRWVICSHKFLLQSDLAGERSQFAAENKTASERTFVRFFSTKHGSLRITVGRWLPKETPIRSAPQLGGIYLIPITRRGSP